MVHSRWQCVKHILFAWSKATDHPLCTGFHGTKHSSLGRQPKRILRSPLTKFLDNSVEYSMDMGSDKNASHDWPLSNPPFLPVWGSTMYAIKNAPNYHTLSIRIGDVGLNSRLPWSSTNGTPLTNKDPRGPLLPLPIVLFFGFVSLNPHNQLLLSQTTGIFSLYV